MKQFRDMTDDEQRAFDQSLQFTGREPLGINPELPDGTLYEWDPVFKVTAEKAPDGRRYVVELRQGKLTRIRELVPNAPGNRHMIAAVVHFMANRFSVGDVFRLDSGARRRLTLRVGRS